MKKSGTAYYLDIYIWVQNAACKTLFSLLAKLGAPRAGSNQLFHWLKGEQREEGIPFAH